MTRPRKNPNASGIRTRDLPLSRRTPKPLGQRGGPCRGGLTKKKTCPTGRSFRRARAVHIFMGRSNSFVLHRTKNKQTNKQTKPHTHKKSAAKSFRSLTEKYSKPIFGTFLDKSQHFEPAIFSKKSCTDFGTFTQELPPRYFFLSYN